MNILSDEAIHDYALSLPQTYMTEQWMGAQVYKVGDADTFKMFAIIRPGDQRLTVKTDGDETVALLVAAGVAERHTHLPRGGWVVLHVDKLDAGDVCERIKSSYDRVVKTLTKSARKKFSLD